LKQIGSFVRHLSKIRIKMQRLILISLTLLIGLAGGSRAFAGNGGQLIIFSQQEDNPVTRDFVAKWLPKIKEIAAAQDIDVVSKDVSKGAPEMITFTPSIVYQNHLGRSLYIGRYTLLDKIKTFIRTVQRMPQQEVDNEKHDVLVWENECATIYTPAKITDLAGSVPAGFDQAAFHEEALKALDKGMKNQVLKKTFNARRNYRAMYMAFYPYRGEDGKLFISAEMYSQFNCVIPIYKRFDNAFEGTWADWKGAFAEAGKQMAEELERQLNSLENGDAMIPVSKKAGVVSWESIGLPLPKAPEGASASAASNVKLGSKWAMDGPVSKDIPIVNFSFMAPLDYYAGEISEMKGSLNLGPGNDLTKSTASFNVGLETLTMGDPSLDHHIGDMLTITDHPRASFTFKSVEALDNAKINFGALSQFNVQGTIELMGIKVPLGVIAQIEPILTEDGQPRLQVYASFQLRLKDNFNIEGPDGPDPAKDTLVFMLNFLLRPG
jgi:polyisoprenoid-binding protein YceI